MEKYVWCVHCGRGYRVSQMRPDPEFPEDGLCAYSDCDGGKMDALPWEVFREGHPDYPEVPVRGVVYDQ